MASTDHSYLIRTISEDGMLIAEDRDFSEDARFDWLSELLRQAEPGEILQLIDTESDLVVAEEIRSR